MYNYAARVRARTRQNFTECLLFWCKCALTPVSFTKHTLNLNSTCVCTVLRAIAKVVDSVRIERSAPLRVSISVLGVYHFRFRFRFVGFMTSAVIYTPCIFSVANTYCTGTTCLNGGTCVDLDRSFECQCTSNFINSQCQTGKCCINSKYHALGI